MKPNPVPTELPSTVTSLRMSIEQHQALKALAARRHRTMSQELRFALEKHIADAARDEEIAA